MKHPFYQTNLPEGHRVEALAKTDYIYKTKPFILYILPVPMDIGVNPVKNKKMQNKPKSGHRDHENTKRTQN